YVQVALTPSINEPVEARRCPAVLFGQREAPLHDEVGAKVLHDVAHLEVGRRALARGLVQWRALRARPHSVRREPDGGRQAEDEELHLRSNLLLLAVCAMVFFSGCSRRHPIVVAAGGDLQLGSRTSAAQLAGLAVLQGDLRFANLEGPITVRGPKD